MTAPYFPAFQLLQKGGVRIQKLFKPVARWFYLRELWLGTFWFNWMQKSQKAQPVPLRKNLYMSPVGKQGKEFLKKVIERFGHDDFDYLIVVYDDTQFPEEVFARCRFVRDQGYKWQFIKKYVSPGSGEKYAYLFLWDDDIDIAGFSPKNYLDIVRRNNLQYSQPALTPDSPHSHKVTLQDPRYKVGRYTDFVEIMVCVFEGGIWPEFWAMIESDYNFWGWGYDSLGKSILGIKNMGVVDQEQVRHTKPPRGWREDSGGHFERFRRKYEKNTLSKFITYGELE
jgi:hypothetical protein